MRKVLLLLSLALPGCGQIVSSWHSHASSDILPVTLLEPLVVRGPTLRCAATAQGTVVQRKYDRHNTWQPTNYVGISASCK